jgi:hypothetical protein
MPLVAPHSRRPPAAAVGLALLSACAAPDLTGLATPEADEPTMLWIAPDSVTAGDTASVHAIGCIATSEVCMFPVRGLRWAVADTLVARLMPGTLQPAHTVRLQARRAGTTVVLVTSASGQQDSVPLVVYP